MKKQKKQRENLVIDPVTNYYGRSNFTQQNELIQKLKKLYKCEYGLITTSGIHAIWTSLHTYCLYNNFTSFNLIMADELYCDTKRVAKYLNQKFVKINIVKYEASTPKQLLQIFNKQEIKDQLNVLFFQSCSNPNGYVFDFSLIQQLRTISKSLYVIVDNTWLTSLIFNPFDFGVDVVVSSLTKYYGAGAAIAGTILFKQQKYYTQAQNNLGFTGIHLSPHDIKLISNNLDTLQQRIQSSSNLTIKLLQQLKQKRLQQINHPFLEEHPSNKLAKLYFKQIKGQILYPSVFTFKVSISKKTSIKIMESNSKILHQTSFGSAYSKTDQWPTYDVKTKLTTIRFSIGYKDNLENILSGIQQIIQKVKQYQITKNQKDNINQKNKIKQMRTK